MATGHWNPGYGNSVSRFRRVQSAYPTVGGGALRDFMNINEDSSELERIRQQAREVWSSRDVNPTSYQDHYNNKTEDVSEFTSSRPTSPTRRNKPHPPLVFLCARMHSVPGFFNADASLGKSTYRVDGSLPTGHQQARASLRTKFIGRPNTASIMQYQRPEGLDGISDPRDRQAMEAWMKMASDDDKEKMHAVLSEKQLSPETMEVMESSQAERIVPSLHRWMRGAGAEESSGLDKIGQSFYAREYGRPNQNIPYATVVDLGTRKQHDLEKTRRATYRHRSKRGDFLIHPEYPPRLQHHRLNGLSSVDLPCWPQRR